MFFPIPHITAPAYIRGSTLVISSQNFVENQIQSLSGYSVSDISAISRESYSAPVRWRNFQGKWLVKSSKEKEKT